MAKDFVITAAGLQKLKDELKQLKDVRLKEIAIRLKEARELGDLSENAEYEEAKNEQAFVSGRILELEQMIKNAKVIKDCEHGNQVNVGCKVTVSIDGEKETYAIVGSAESDPVNGYISSDSPIGKALIGCKKGDTVKVTAPAGQIEYRVVEIA
jgi:transcription elongation factor GreA